MRRALIIAALLMAAPNVVGQVRLSEETFQWRLYKLESERLAVALPAPPAWSIVKTLSDPLRKGRLEQRLLASDGRRSFIVLIFQNSNSMKLDDFVAEHNTHNEWDLASERPIKVGGAVGKELLSPNKNAVSQLFVKDKRLYGFVATGAGPTDAAVKSFFASIQLKKRLDGVEVSEVPGSTLYSEPITDAYKGSEVEQKVRLISKRAADYTPQARNEQLSGTVVLKVLFTGDGRIVNIRVVEALPYGLTDQAIEAARTIKFTPARKDGKPVSVWMQLEYNFNLF